MKVKKITAFLCLMCVMIFACVAFTGCNEVTISKDEAQALMAQTNSEEGEVPTTEQTITYTMDKVEIKAKVGMNMFGEKMNANFNGIVKLSDVGLDNGLVTLKVSGGDDTTDAQIYFDAGVASKYDNKTKEIETVDLYKMISGALDDTPVGSNFEIKSSYDFDASFFALFGDKVVKSNVNGGIKLTFDVDVVKLFGKIMGNVTDMTDAQAKAMADMYKDIKSKLSFILDKDNAITGVEFSIKGSYTMDLGFDGESNKQKSTIDVSFSVNKTDKEIVAPSWFNPEPVDDGSLD